MATESGGSAVVWGETTAVCCVTFTVTPVGARPNTRSSCSMFKRSARSKARAKRSMMREMRSSVLLSGVRLLATNCLVKAVTTSNSRATSARNLGEIGKRWYSANCLSAPRTSLRTSEKLGGVFSGCWSVC
jgi:hypothetical protein